MNIRVLMPVLAVCLVSLGMAEPQIRGDLHDKRERKEDLFGPKADNAENKDPNACILQGVVTDPAHNLVKGAVVRLKDMKSLKVRSVVTDEDGSYRFTGLSKVVDYEVSASTEDMTSPIKKLSMYDTARSAVRNLELKKKAGSKKDQTSGAR
jgi:hypothetical protein